MKKTVLKDNEIKFWEFLQTVPRLVKELASKYIVQEIEIMDNVLVFKGLHKTFRVVKLSENRVAVLHVK